MLLEVRNHTVVIRREVGDPVFRSDDSRLFYHVKKSLIRLGYDCVKKRAWKDGHLVDNHMLYIRDRKKRWFLYDPAHATRSIAQSFDREGEVCLRISSDTIATGLLK